jgi:hypothetical protein
VDDHEHALGLGEIYQSKLGKEHVVELEDLLNVRRKEYDAGLLEITESGMISQLREGLVIYKSIGVDLMGLVVGTAVLSLARKPRLCAAMSDL